MSIEISIVNKSNNPLPAYQSVHAAGLDLCAFLTEPVVIGSGKRELIGTGIYIALPHGYEGQIRPRSGLALKNGITVLNTPGTIDADYRGEIKIVLINLGAEPFVVHNGDRIAQMIISKYEQISWNPTTSLDHTERGSGGYGHTGIKNDTTE